MKKIYVLVFTLVSTTSILFFQNCSKSQYKSGSESQQSSTGQKDPDIIDEPLPPTHLIAPLDQAAKIESTSDYAVTNSQVIYQYSFNRPSVPPSPFDINTTDYFTEAYTSGLQILDDGSIQEFYGSVQFKVGVLDGLALQSFKERSLAVQNNNSPLSNSFPPCPGGSSSKQVLFNALGQEFILTQNGGCSSEAVRSADAVAIQLGDELKRLATRVSSISRHKVLLQSTLQSGFAPIQSPTLVILRIYVDGRVMRYTSYLPGANKPNKYEIIGLVSALDIEQIKNQVKDLSGQNIILSDTQPDTAMCADAPVIEYSFPDKEPRSCPYPPPGAIDSCSSADINRVFAKSANCHQYRDSRFQVQSANLANYFSQFRFY